MDPRAGRTDRTPTLPTMRGALAPRAIVLALLATGLAGCVDPDASAADAELASASVRAPFRAEWSGHYVASGGYEALAHFSDTEAVGSLLWPNAMMDILVGPAPRSIVAHVNWTGAGQVQLMVNPAGPPAEATEYTAPGPDAFSGESPLCVLVPADGLREGVWQFMLHTAAGATIDYTITVEIDGTAEGPTQHKDHWMSSTEYLGAAAGGTIPKVAAAC